ncbi:MAG: hypothetical protein CHACPFDD_00439 [Phycisphaerae bacterium]|nr:hypothetical protein [Phycisphaerae bacterium]
MGVPSEHEAPASEGSAAEGGCSPWHARHGSSAGQARPHLPLGGPTEELEPATYLTGLSAAHRDSTMACQSRARQEAVSQPSRARQQAVSQTEPRPSASGFSDRAAPVGKRFLRPNRARQQAVSQTEPRPSASGFSDRAAPVSKRFLRPSRARQQAVSQTEPRPSGSGFSDRAGVRTAVEGFSRGAKKPLPDGRGSDPAARLRSRCAAQTARYHSPPATPVTAGDTRHHRRHPSPPPPPPHGSASSSTNGSTSKPLKLPSWLMSPAQSAWQSG